MDVMIFVRIEQNTGQIIKQLNEIIKLLEFKNSSGIILGSCSECTCDQIIPCPIHGPIHG